MSGLLPQIARVATDSSALPKNVWYQIPLAPSNMRGRAEPPAALTHQQQVTRLYRSTLRQLLAWLHHRPTFLAYARVVRETLDEHAALEDTQRTQRLVARWSDALAFYEHPDRYRSPSSEDGTEWERNLPVPRELLARRGYNWDGEWWQREAADGEGAASALSPAAFVACVRGLLKSEK